MARKITECSPTPGLSAAEKAELRELLARIPRIDPNPPRDIGPSAPRSLIAALEFVFAHGVTTGEHLRAYPCRGGEWVIDSRVVDALRRLVG